jgi:hypothetical protein
MSTDAEQLAYLRAENVKLNEQLKAAQIDAADALFKLSHQSRSWSSFSRIISLEISASIIMPFITATSPSLA